jgi:hypothetical protein
LAYAVEADLNLSNERLIELTDSAAVPGVIDAAVMARTETEAESIVNGLLSDIPGVPFVGTPPTIITTITAWLWACRLYRHRETMDAPQSVKDDCAMAMEMLAKMAEAGSIPGLEATSSGVLIRSSEPRGWTHRGLGDDT